MRNATPATSQGLDHFVGDPEMTVQSSVNHQERLGPAWLANQPDTDTEHVVVVLPSHSVAGSLLSHYAQRIPALEHRYLVAYLLLHRFQHCEIVYVCSQAPEPEVVDNYYERSALLIRK